MSVGNLKHGELCRGNHSKEADIWVSMLQRCRNPSCESFPNYGGRGITVCERWSGDDGLSNFIADMGRKPSGCSIDRIDNDGPYSPENCRWATRKEQQRNRRANCNVTIGTETKCLTEWAEVLGINIKTVYKRIHVFGWEPLRALTEPVTGRGRRANALTVNGETRPISEWSAISGITTGTIRDRLRFGWTAENAVFQPLQRKGN